MKVLISHTDFDTVSADARKKNAAWLQEMRQEHEGYYAKDHAQINRTKQVFGRVELRAGYIDADDAAMILLDLKTNVLEMEWHEILRELTSEERILGGWLTSAGNLTVVCGHWEYREGRRHGVRNAQPSTRAGRDGRSRVSSWHYFESQCPNESPDAKGLTPAEAA